MTSDADARRSLKIGNLVEAMPTESQWAGELGWLVAIGRWKCYSGERGSKWRLLQLWQLAVIAVMDGHGGRRCAPETRCKPLKGHVRTETLRPEAPTFEPELPKEAEAPGT